MNDQYQSNLMIYVQNDLEALGFVFLVKFII